MPETVLICARTRQRAIEIATACSVGEMQGELQASSFVPGAQYDWAYIGCMRDLFGRPERLRVILDDTAKRLPEWKAICRYLAVRDYVYDLVGSWTRWELVMLQEKQGPDGETTRTWIGPGVVDPWSGVDPETRRIIEADRASLERVERMARAWQEPGDLVVVEARRGRGEVGRRKGQRFEEAWGRSKPEPPKPVTPEIIVPKVRRIKFD